MIKIIIATHSTLADGYKNTIDLIGVNSKNVISLCFYVDETNHLPRITELFNELSNEDQMIVCTDVMYGSVNQLFMKELINYKDKNIILISGINLPLLLELTTRSENISNETVQSIIETSKSQIICVDLEEINKRCCLEDDLME